MISEIAIFETSAPDADIASPESPFRKSLQQHLQTVLTFDGAQAAYYGQLIEKPTIIVVVVNWDNLDSHVKATKSPGFSANGSSFQRNLIKENGSATVFHVPFKENMLDALQPRTASGEVGVTEIVFASFKPSPLPQAAKEAILQSFNHVEPVIERHGALTGYRNGWAVEGLSTPLLEKLDAKGSEKGEKSAVYVNLTGWDKMESHMRFMETQDFKDNLHWFMDVEGGTGGEIVHARFYEV